MTWWREARSNGASWTWSLAWPLAWIWDHAAGLACAAWARLTDRPTFGEHDRATRTAAGAAMLNDPDEE